MVTSAGSQKQNAFPGPNGSDASTASDGIMASGPNHATSNVTTQCLPVPPQEPQHQSRPSATYSCSDGHHLPSLIQPETYCAPPTTNQASTTTNSRVHSSRDQPSLAGSGEARQAGPHCGHSSSDVHFLASGPTVSTDVPPEECPAATPSCASLPSPPIITSSPTSPSLKSLQSHKPREGSPLAGDLRRGQSPREAGAPKQVPLEGEGRGARLNEKSQESPMAEDKVWLVPSPSSERNLSARGSSGTSPLAVGAGKATEAQGRGSRGSHRGGPANSGPGRMGHHSLGKCAWVDPNELHIDLANSPRTIRRQSRRALLGVETWGAKSPLGDAPGQVTGHVTGGVGSRSMGSLDFLDSQAQAQGRGPVTTRSQSSKSQANSACSTPLPMETGTFPQGSTLQEGLGLGPGHVSARQGLPAARDNDPSPGSPGGPEGGAGAPEVSEKLRQRADRRNRLQSILGVVAKP